MWFFWFISLLPVPHHGGRPSTLLPPISYCTSTLLKRLRSKSLSLAFRTHSWAGNGLHPSEWPCFLWKRAGEPLNVTKFFFGTPVFHRTHSRKCWSVRTFRELYGAKQNIFISFATEILISSWVGFMEFCYLTTPFREAWNGSFASCLNCNWFGTKADVTDFNR